MTTQEKLQALLEENLTLLNKAAGVLGQSHEVCKNLSDPEGFEELESVEAFTARFARVADIYTQKLVPNVLALMGEDLPTTIDRANFLEKLGLIESADLLLDMRRVRNDIAHDYAEEDFLEVFKACKRYTPELMKVIANTKTYISERL